MAFKFKDLIVTLIPHGHGAGECDSTSGGCDSTSGGCGGTCDAGSGGTVGSCTSECGGFGPIAGCGQSDEVLNPLVGLIDPPYLVDLRLMLRLALAKSLSARVAKLEATMQPRTLQEVEMLEHRLKAALVELDQERQRLQKKG